MRRLSVAILVLLAGAFVGCVPDSPTSCVYSIDPVAGSYTASGGITSVAVTAPTGCAWVAESPCPWVTVTPSGGTGGDAVTVQVQANGTTLARTCAVTIAGLSFNVMQEGSSAPPPPPSSCTYTGNRSSKTLHYTWCSYVGQMADANKVCFDTKAEALAAGYTTMCSRCKP